MARSRGGEEGENNEKEKQWKLRGTVTLLMALAIVVLDIVVLALGTIWSAVPIAFSTGCVGVITFIGVLMLSNYLSHDPELAKKEVRKAITASFTLVYLVLLALVVFTKVPDANAELAKTIVGHFTWIVGIIIIFYFGSRTVEEYLKRKE